VSPAASVAKPLEGSLLGVTVVEAAASCSSSPCELSAAVSSVLRADVGPPRVGRTDIFGFRQVTIRISLWLYRFLISSRLTDALFSVTPPCSYLPLLYDTGPEACSCTSGRCIGLNHSCPVGMYVGAIVICSLERSSGGVDDRERRPFSGTASPSTDEGGYHEFLGGCIGSRGSTFALYRRLGRWSVCDRDVVGGRCLKGVWLGGVRGWLGTG